MDSDPVSLSLSIGRLRHQLDHMLQSRARLTDPDVLRTGRALDRRVLAFHKLGWTDRDRARMLLEGLGAWSRYFRGDVPPPAGRSSRW